MIYIITEINEVDSYLFEETDGHLYCFSFLFRTPKYRLFETLVGFVKWILKKIRRSWAVPFGPEHLDGLNTDETWYYVMAYRETKNKHFMMDDRNM